MMAHEEEDVFPNATDVLCGSGNMKSIHPGNQRFRQIAAAHYVEYAAAASKAEKMKVSRRIMKEILHAGTRFLKKDTGSQKWYVANLRVGKDKMSHCLRDFKKNGECETWAKNQIESPVAAMRRSGQLLREASKRSNRVRKVQPFLPPAACPSSSPPSSTVHNLHSKTTTQQRPLIDTYGLSEALLRDIPIPTSWDNAPRSWEAQKDGPHSQDPLLLEFATAFSDNQQINKNDAEVPQKVMYSRSNTHNNKAIQGQFSSEASPQQPYRKCHTTSSYCQRPPIVQQCNVAQETYPLYDLCDDWMNTLSDVKDTFFVDSRRLTISEEQ